LRDGLKQKLLRFAKSNISISRAVAAHLDQPSQVIGDPYREDVFTLAQDAPRTNDLIFVGRLVSDKGADLLFDALRIAKEKGRARRLTMAGDGPERAKLERQAEGLDVRFAGVVCDTALADLLNTHGTLVIPSRWNEPFGIVALEAIACGCAVIGSEGGGLPEAIGPCGVTFPNGDADALAECLLQELPLDEYRGLAAEHLAPHRPEVVARAYLEIFEEALG
jgi:glycosyltransferase involved in cell wall biosynthesis